MIGGYSLYFQWVEVALFQIVTDIYYPTPWNRFLSLVLLDLGPLSELEIPLQPATHIFLKSYSLTVLEVSFWNSYLRYKCQHELLKFSEALVSWMSLTGNLLTPGL